MTNSVKYDSDKPSLDLLPFTALVEVGKVLSYGAAKYSRDNWRQGNGLAWSRLLAAAMRHLFAWGSGENRDPETGLSHLAHATCCILFLLSYEVDGGGHDDRWGKTVKQEQKKEPLWARTAMPNSGAFVE